MSKCEACGGDGQIEYGAYRGDEAGPTRECRLCGGAVTATGLAAVGLSAVEAGSALKRLGQASAGITLMSSVDGLRVPEATFATERHRHQWSFHVKGHTVHFECVNNCGTKMIFSRHGSLLKGKPLENSFEMDYLSRRAASIYESNTHALNTAKEVADARLAQLKRENERLQREAEAANYEPTTSARAADAEMNDLIRGML